MNDDKIVIKFPFGFGLFYFLLGIAVLFLSLCFFTDGVAEDRILAFITLIAGVLSARFGIYIFRYRLEISPLGCIYRTL